MISSKLCIVGPPRDTGAVILDTRAVILGPCFGNGVRYRVTSRIRKRPLPRSTIGPYCRVLRGGRFTSEVPL